MVNPCLLWRYMIEKKAGQAKLIATAQDRMSEGGI